MESLSDRQFQVLLKEYDLLQNKIKDYDARSFQIKGWSITIFSAVVSIAIINSKPILLMVPFFTSLIFLGLDGLYKSFQYLVIQRSLEIEEQFNAKENIVVVGYLSHCFFGRDNSLIGRIKRVGSRLFVFNVMALYLSKIIVLLIISVVAI